MPARPHRPLAIRLRDLLERKTTELTETPLEFPVCLYRSRRIFEAEVEGWLPRTPIVASPSCRLPEPQDYVVRDVLGRSLLVTRDADGTAHVHLNVCRHRGARIVEGSGKARRFTCPYHAWTYDARGALVGRPCEEGFQGLGRERSGLVRLPSVERHGFIWCLLDPAASLDLDAHLGEFGDELATWGYEDFTYLSHMDIPLGTNWKSGIEAFCETYHFPFVHGRSQIGMGTIPNTVTFDAFGPHHRLGVPLRTMAEYDGDVNTAAEEELEKLVSVLYWIFPDVVLANSMVGVEFIQITPADSPGRSWMHHAFLSKLKPPSEEIRAGLEAIAGLTRQAVREEDGPVLQRCGEGLRAAAHPKVVIGRNEPGVQNVLTQLQRAVRPWLVNEPAD
jgi:choline monooxygenase